MLSQSSKQEGFVCFNNRHYRILNNDLLRQEEIYNYLDIYVSPRGYNVT